MFYVLQFFGSIFQKNFKASLLEVSDIDYVKDSLEEYPESVQVQNQTQIDVAHIVGSPDTVFSRTEEKHTSFDLQEIRGVFKTDASVQEYFLQWFKLGLTRKDGFEKVNDFYQAVVEIYETRYLRKIPNSLKSLRFDSVKDIRKFLNSTGQGRLGIYRCELVKLFLSYARSSTEEAYAQIKDIHKQINSLVHKPFSISGEENISGSTIIDSRFEGEFHGVNFSGYTRYKSLFSIVGKEVANSAYNSLTDFRDLHGYTFNCKSKKDVLLLLQQFFHSGVLEDMEIENKDLISDEDVKSHPGLDDRFKSYLLGEITKSREISSRKQTKKGNSKKYQEIKIRGKAKYTNPKNPNSQDNYTGVEVKFQLEDNQNEYGNSFHGILEMKKRLRELTRLSTIVRLKDVVSFVNNFFDELPGELALKGKTLEDYIPELIQDFQDEGIISRDISFEKGEQEIPEELYLGLFKYLERDLMRVKKNNRSKKWYYVHNTYAAKSGAGIVPEVEIMNE